MLTPDELYALCIPLCDRYRKFSRTALTHNDLLQIARLAVTEHLSQSPPADTYPPTKPIAAARRALRIELRKARQANRNCNPDALNEVVGSVADRYNDHKRENRHFVRTARTLFLTVARTCDPRAIDALERIHCYDQDPRTVADEMGLDLIEVDGLVKVAGKAIRDELGQRRWRVLRGTITGLLDEYEYQRSPYCAGDRRDEL